MVSLVHALSLFISGDEGSGFSAIVIAEFVNERATNDGARMAPATVLRSMVLFICEFFGPCLRNRWARARPPEKVDGAPWVRITNQYLPFRAVVGFLWILIDCCVCNW